MKDKYPIEEARAYVDEIAKINKIKWYHYAAKIIVMTMLTLVMPFLGLLALSVGESPLFFYKIIWGARPDE